MSSYTYGDVYKRQEVDMIIIRPEKIVKHHTVTCIVVASSIILTEFRKILGAQLLKLYIHIIVFSFLTAAHLRQPFPVFHEKYFLLLWFPCFLLFIVYHTSIIK